LWEAWIEGKGIVPQLRSEEELIADGARLAQELAGKLSPAEREAAGMVLATTKGEISKELAWIRARDRLSGCAGNSSAVAKGSFEDGCKGPLPASTDQATCFEPLSALAGRWKRHARVNGPAWAVSTACSSGLVAMIDAACAILDRDAQHMLAFGVDFAGDFVRDGFAALKAISPTTCRPFDRDRDGLMLGSGVAACLLSRGADARCRMTGWGLACDAVHMTAPDRNANGLIRAMQAALAMARLSPKEVDVLFVHGTGTRYNDAMEAVAIDAVFRAGNEPGPAITGVKGLIGHTLGASGLIEALLAAKMIEAQIVPPITGLVTPERTDLDLLMAPRRMRVRHVMKVASGFGGLNAALILSDGEGGP
jgi:3-oxoacyl-[acyl-carrier-protein] synthase II